MLSTLSTLTKQTMGRVRRCTSTTQRSFVIRDPDYPLAQPGDPNFDFVKKARGRKLALA
jgi:hypothetical protein